MKCGTFGLHKLQIINDKDKLEIFLFLIISKNFNKEARCFHKEIHTIPLEENNIQDSLYLLDRP